MLKIKIKIKEMNEFTQFMNVFDVIQQTQNLHYIYKCIHTLSS